MGLSPEWNALVTSPGMWIAGIAAVGTYFTARPAVADIGLKRRLETAKQFGDLTNRVNNITSDVGLYEQIAAVWMIADFGARERHLRRAARAVLEVVAERQEPAVEGGESPIAEAAREALKIIDG